MTGATPGTIRHWLRNGLEPVTGCFPVIIRGIDLIDFLNRRNASRKRPCGPGRLFCFRCKEPKRPAFDEVEFWQDGPKLGSLRGLCPTCAGIMDRRTSVGRIKMAAGDLCVSIQHAEPRLIEMTKPCSNPHSEGA